MLDYLTRVSGMACLLMSLTVQSRMRGTTCVDDLPTHFVHMIPTFIFISYNPLTGRTDRLHIFQMLVPSHRAQVLI